MTHTQLIESYQERRRHFATQAEHTTRRINVISNLRLATAALVLLFFYLAFYNPLYGIGALILMAVFLMLVKRHALKFDERTHLQNLVKINEVEIALLRRETVDLFSGQDFVHPEHPYSHDLDLFGDGSLYQYLNRCNTRGGRTRLARTLEEPFRDKAHIIDQQQSIRDLAPRIEFRQHFQASGMEANEQVQDIDELLAWTKQPPFLSGGKLLPVLLVAIPVVTICALLLAYFFPATRIILWIMVITQWIMTAIHLKKINFFHEQISRKKTILLKYARLLHFLETEKFNAPTLRQFAGQAHEASSQVEKLASLVSALNARSNALVTLFVNSILLYDLQCVFRLEQWKLKNQNLLQGWLETIWETERLNSLGTYAYNNPPYTFATITDQLNIEAIDLAHPLISETERVPNSLVLGPSPSVLIITGANMAGKSTFLRTLGVNLVLALNGAPVCATSFTCPVINLRSGMRTADSLKDHQSYFYAELNRLKSIMEELRSDKPLLILLDEILKGTNSNDKQAGSMALVKQLLPHPCLALIATHDLALGDLETEYPSQVKNYCFEANIENDQLSFDYKLKHGLAQNMNASFLMRKMGIIPSN